LCGLAGRWRSCRFFDEVEVVYAEEDLRLLGGHGLGRYHWSRRGLRLIFEKGCERRGAQNSFVIIVRCITEE